MVIATMTNKGQVTIPKTVRDTLGLHSGDKLEFSCEKGGRIVVTPIKKSVDDLFGKLFDPERKALSIQEINDVVRLKFRQQVR
ncbi:AbrB/MazE/SpoVT family DNA-binding domain-containing protein [Chlorobium sp. KB01]|uniref:AbrB/MazE/SpoVT family DNA-binding domain-containing protein n=1 Tax=Chlorobium sp. KB01 TaxID=1917528 RepID=UPI000975D195|nr:AbrB/MazE/SpoVT family DNA-binding domain-containing protein [Chlorobium sp. KB01]